MRDKEKIVMRKKTRKKKFVEKMPTSENGKIMLQKKRMVKNFDHGCGYRK